MKIIDYCILYSEEEIKEKIKEGWQPWGSLAVTRSPGYAPSYYQAMVKYEEVKSEEKE